MFCARERLLIKHTVIHSELGFPLFQARHGDAIILCDANMPIPAECRFIDLSLMREIPSLVQTLKAILNDMVIEHYQVFDLMPQHTPEMYQTIQALLPQIPGSTINRAELEQQMKGAKAVVRTGDFGSCCTMVLYSASGMEKYVKRFDCAFSFSEK